MSAPNAQRAKHPGTRLLTALPYLTEGGMVADIGTDHAYLPIELLNRGISRRAVACDINKGPIECARANIRSAGLSDRIETFQTDGLHGVECYRPDDILIFGMGGELIVKILSEAPWIRNPAIGLILQPMTHAEILRRWLIDSGFSILGESLSFEEQYYQTVYARFGGAPELYTDADLFAGKQNLIGNSPWYSGFLRRKIEILSAAAEGKRKGNIDTADEERLIKQLCSRLAEQKED